MIVSSDTAGSSAVSGTGGRGVGGSIEIGMRGAGAPGATAFEGGAAGAGAAAEAENLIDLQVGHFFAELKALEHQGGLLRLRSHIAQVRDRHLEKARLALARGEDADAVMETLAHQLSNKILHGPTSAWKRAALEGDTALLRAAEQLFRLDDDAQP